MKNSIHYKNGCYRIAGIVHINLIMSVSIH